MTDASGLAAASAGAFKRGFGAVLRIAPTDGTPFDIDGRGEDCAICSPTAATPDCVWTASSETLTRIFEGGRALESAYLSGRLSITGDMSVMARLALESAR
jgi:putative sterol carrier protein